MQARAISLILVVDGIRIFARILREWAVDVEHLKEKVNDIAVPVSSSFSFLLTFVLFSRVIKPST